MHALRVQIPQVMERVAVVDRFATLLDVLDTAVELLAKESHTSGNLGNLTHLFHDSLSDAPAK